MTKTHQIDSPELTELKGLIQSPIETELHFHNVNERLRRLFGGTAVSNLHRPPKFLVAMRFKEVYEPAHKVVPAIDHQAFARNDRHEKDTGIRVLSPFVAEGSRYPLLAVSFSPEALLSDPFLSLEIRPIPESKTIYSCVMRQADIMKSGEIMLALSDVRH